MKMLLQIVLRMIHSSGRFVSNGVLMAFEMWAREAGFVRRLGSGQE
jgi:hypothetical protein